MSLKIYAYVHSNEPNIKYYCYVNSENGQYVYKIIKLGEHGQIEKEEDITKKAFEAIGEVVIYSNKT